MTTIRLLDARSGLNLKCRELFRDEKIADSIYRYLCDGIEECEDAEPERKKGEWIIHENADIVDGYYVPKYECSYCHTWKNDDSDFCPDCGADMREEQK